MYVIWIWHKSGKNITIYKNKKRIAEGKIQCVPDAYVSASGCINSHIILITWQENPLL